MFPWTTAAPDSQASDAEESVESVDKGLEVESEELMSMLRELRMDEFSNRASNLLHHSQSQRRTQMPPQIATATLVVNAPPVPPIVSRCEVTQVAAEDEIVEPTVVAPLPPIEQPRARASRQRVQAIPGRSESSGPSVPTSNDATVAPTAKNRKRGKNAPAAITAAEALPPVPRPKRTQTRAGDKS